MVGDNVGNVSGTGTDFLGSWVEVTCISLYLSAQIPDISNAGWEVVCFPLLILSSGILASIITTSFAVHISPEVVPRDVEATLRLQLVVTSILMIPFVLALSLTILPSKFMISSGFGRDRIVYSPIIAICIVMGIFVALGNALISKYCIS